MDRREFISTLAAAAFSQIDAAKPASTPEGVRPARVDFVVYDERYSDARRFAIELANAGAQPLPTEGEVVTLWRERLRAARRGEPLVVAGLTTHSDFDLLRQLASERGLRVRHQRLRTCEPRNDLAHFKAGTLVSFLLG